MSSFAVMVLPTLIAGLILAVFYCVSANRDRMHKQESRRIHAILKGEVRIGRSRPSVDSGGRMRRMEGKLRASA